MYACLDLETTGLNPVLDEICEIAVIVYDKNFKKKKEFHTLLKTYNPISEDVTAIHGITNDMVADKPYFEEIVSTVTELLTGNILVGQNIRIFDIPFLAEKLFQLDLTFDINEFKIIDTLQIDTIHRPRNLAALYLMHTGKVLEGAHSALNDTEAAMEVLKGQVAEYKLDLTSDDINKTLGFTSKYVDPQRKLIYIDGVVCWAIGKHKNKPVAADINYANWSLGSDFPKSTKFYIQKEIDKVK